MRHIISQNPQEEKLLNFKECRIKRKNNGHMIGDTDNTPSYFTSTDGSFSPPVVLNHPQDDQWITFFLRGGIVCAIGVTYFIFLKSYI